MIKNQAKWFAFVWLVFFPFLVNWSLKDEGYDLNWEEKKFINSYKQIGWLILFGLFVTVILYVIGIWFKLDYLFSLANLVLLLSFSFLFVHIFLLFSGKPPLMMKDLSVNIETTKVDSFDINLLFAYVPFLNYYLLLTNKAKYLDHLKQANMLYFLLFLIWVLSLYFPLENLFYFVLFIIIVRGVSLFMWIDISYFNFLAKYRKFPYEVLVYVEAGFYFLVNNLFLVLKNKSTVPYKVYVDQIVDFYLKGFEFNKVLKKIKKYLFLHISYAVFLFFVLFNIWNSWAWENYIAIFSLVWFAYYFILPCWVEAKLYPLPFISLITFYILKKF